MFADPDPDPLRLVQLPADPAPLRSAADVAAARAAVAVDPYAVPAEAVPPLPMLRWSGIVGRTPADRIPVALGVPHRPAPSVPMRRADDLARADRLASDAHERASADAETMARCSQRPFPSEAPEGLFPLFVAGDPHTWRAIRSAAVRGVRERIVRTDGRGDVTIDRWQPVDPEGAVASEAMALAWRRFTGPRPWGRRGEPTTTGALVGYVRAIARKLATGPVPSVGKRRAAAHAALARAAVRSAAQVAEDQEEVAAALAHAVAESFADASHGARTRRRLLDVALDFHEIAATGTSDPAS